jgi:parallel beta-helix repeat protein
MSKYKIFSVICILAIVIGFFTINSNQLFTRCFDDTTLNDNQNQIDYKLSNDEVFNAFFAQEHTFLSSSVLDNNFSKHTFTIDEADTIQQHHTNVLIVNTTNNNYFNTIQQAINNAKDNSLIYVTEGQYPEILTINKKVTILGENKNTTLINPTSTPNSYAITITQSNVTLTGFSIQNKADGLYTTAIKILAPYTTISDCTLFDTPVGIAIWSSHNTISHCYFTGCDDEGIVLLGNSYSTVCCTIITHCVFYQNGDGIEIQSSSENKIITCHFLHNTHAGIDIIGKQNVNNQIITCLFDQNNAYAIILTDCYDTLIMNSLFTTSSIFSFDSKNTTIQESIVNSFILVNESFLCLIDCENISQENIQTIDSSYKIIYGKKVSYF